MIGDIPDIRRSVAALSVKEVEPHEDHQNAFLVCERRRRVSTTGSPFRDGTAVVLLQDEGAPIKILRLVDRIALELHNNGHTHAGPRSPHQTSLAVKILALAAALRSDDNDSCSVLNTLISAISDTRVTQFAMLVGSARRPEHYRFGSFTYGELDLRLLRSRVEYVGSDFYDRCGEALRGRLCISRDQREISAIPVNGIRITVQVLPAWGSPIHRILDDYYQELADAERRQFALELDRQQAIFGAAGVGTLSGDTFGRIPAVTDWITVITRNQRKAGWVTPDQVFIGISTPEPKVLADGYDALRSSLQLFDWGERSIDAWIQTYCEYITTAQAYEESGRIEEALLHLVFSLGHLNSKTHSA